MIKVENKYDFTVEELTDILNDTPIKVDLDTNEAVAEYIIQALNVNSIIKGCKEKEPGEQRSAYHTEAAYNLCIRRNKDGSVVCEKDVRAVAFYAYDPLFDKISKAIVSKSTPTDAEVLEICELLGSCKDWRLMN